MIDDAHIDRREFERRIGDDTPPLMNRVHEPPPSHWGKMTSLGRTNSSDYLRFVSTKKNKEVPDGRAT
ncbi:MAG: hypothetical protein EBR82_73245 [Caulobacteraceae bacterium]|nr:hypothetical protein [Caulobacteraceae bacterium]